MKFNAQLKLTPIGIIETPFDDKSAAPRQPGIGKATEAIVRLYPHRNFEQALEGLDGFEKIWLIYLFDRNEGWKPLVRTPCGGETKRPLFTTRSPYRPNPIGISAVDLIDVRGLSLRVANVDLLNGTPILDIKPYLPSADAFPNAKAGWTDEIPRYERIVTITQEAAAVAEQVLRDTGIDILARVKAAIEHEDLGDPALNHPYKRLRAVPTGFELAIKSWRIHFTYDAHASHVTIDDIRSA